MYHLCILALPILLPVGCKVLSSRDIADRRVKPYVEHLAICTLYRHRNTPVEVTAYGTWLKAEVEPALALTIYVRLPLLVTIQDPLAEEALILIQRQVPVLCLALYGHSTRYGALGVDQLIGRERRATLLTLVAICLLVLATGACTYDVAVCEEGLSLLVVELLRCLLDELTLII